MTRQLKLLDLDRPEWRLDERTRAVGREGIAQARAALRQARENARTETVAGGHGERSAA